MKIRDEKGRVCEDKILRRLLELLGLYDDSEEWFLEPKKEYIVYDPISGQIFRSGNEELIKEATRKINEELKDINQMLN